MAQRGQRAAVQHDAVRKHVPTQACHGPPSRCCPLAHLMPLPAMRTCACARPAWRSAHPRTQRVLHSRGTCNGDCRKVPACTTFSGKALRRAGRHPEAAATGFPRDEQAPAPPTTEAAQEGAPPRRVFEQRQRICLCPCSAAWGPFAAPPPGEQLQHVAYEVEAAPQGQAHHRSAHNCVLQPLRCPAVAITSPGHYFMAVGPCKQQTCCPNRDQGAKGRRQEGSGGWTLPSREAARRPDIPVFIVLLPTACNRGLQGCQSGAWALPRHTVRAGSPVQLPNQLQTQSKHCPSSVNANADWNARACSWGFSCFA